MIMLILTAPLDIFVVIGTQVIDRIVVISSLPFLLASSDFRIPLLYCCVLDQVINGKLCFLCTRVVLNISMMLYLW